jgi:hypothetical protein
MNRAKGRFFSAVSAASSDPGSGREKRISLTEFTELTEE